MNLFPYTPRKNQIAIIQTIKKILNDEGHLVFESGTGSGKTICTITATLEYAFENNKKIVYTTRTNAQQRQVIIELRQICNKNPNMKNRIFGVGIQGRSNMCILARKDSELSSGTSEELSRFCSNIKKKTKIDNKNEGCIYYRNFLDKEKTNQAINWFKENLPTAEEFIRYCERRKLCPYEINKILMREAKIIVVPYIYVFDLMIRNMLLDNISTSENDIILVVDEAHNLPDYIRDLYSTQLSIYMLNNCILEAEKYGDPTVLEKNTVTDFCKTLINIINDLRDTYVYGILEDGIRYGSPKNVDAFIPAHEFEEEILSRLKITSKKLHEIIGNLIAYGEKIQEYRQKEDKLPRSYLHKLGLFLDFWFSLEMNQYTKLIVDAANGKNPRVEAFCLDPSLGAEIIKHFHSTIHMSGTLEPLEEYRDSLGLPEDTELVSYPSPFPEHNRKILFVKDVSTKYDEFLKDEKMVTRMGEYISNICNNFPKNTMVFFPSFNIMAAFKRNNTLNSINRCVYYEEQKMSQTALMELISDFKEHGNNNGEKAALFSVMGGRISEGMDFPAEQLEIVIIVGIPYPKPTARQRALQHYYDLKFRKGWEYTVEAPAARKILQSIGRLIRDENDRGVAVILDRRATRFKKYIRYLEESTNPLKEINDFLSI